MKGLAAVPALFLAVAAAAQTPLPRAGETIDVSIVNVDVVVTDRHGNHIRGLAPSDFEIRDNGVVQPISNFAEYEDSGAARFSATTADGLKPAAPQQKRAIVLFVERQQLTPKEAASFVASMKKLVHDTIRAGDTAAVVSFGYTTHIDQDFTGDLAKLDAAIDRVRPMFDAFGEDTEGEAIRNAHMQELIDDEAAFGGSFGPSPALLNGTERAVRELVDIRRKARVLQMLVNNMAGIDGRKAIFLATRRFGQYAGWEFIGTGLGAPSADEMSRYDTRPLREELTRSANAAGVTFYAIYPEGLPNIPFANVEQGPMNLRRLNRVDRDQDQVKLSKAQGIVLNETKAIGDLAAETGGVAGWGFTDIAKIASVMRDDLSSYYSLAFRAPKDAKTHKIAVTAKNHAYVVRSRREFVEKTDEEQMSDRVASALYQPQHAPALQFEVEVGALKKSRNRYTIPVVVRIPTSGLTAIPDRNGRSGSFRVYSVAGGLLGVSSDVHSQSQPFTIPPNQDPQLFTYSFEMLTDTHADRIVVGVYDELSKQSGVVKIALTAPAPTSP